MKQISNAQDLLEVFAVPTGPYFSPVELRGGKTGFSIKRHYPADIRFKPAFLANGCPDDVIVFWIKYEFSRLNPVTGFVPIHVSFGKFSMYLADHIEYDYNDPNCPTRESVELSSRCSQPLSGEINQEFVFSTKSGALETVEGTPVTGIQVLDRAYTEHCDSVHPIKGLRARSEVAWHDGVHNSLNRLEAGLAWLLKNIFGRQRAQSNGLSIFPDAYTLADYERVPEDNIEVAGYKASKRVVLVFAALVALLSYLLLPAADDSYLKVLAGSEFLMLIHALIFLVALDEGVPRLLFGCVNLVLKARKWYFFRAWKRHG